MLLNGLFNDLFNDVFIDLFNDWFIDLGNGTQDLEQPLLLKQKGTLILRPVPQGEAKPRRK